MKRKPEYVTREEFDRHQDDTGIHNTNILSWYIVISFCLSMIACLAIFIIVSNGFYSQTAGLEKYCAQKETTITYHVDDSCVYLHDGCVSCCNQTAVKKVTNRCLDWRFRDKEVR